MEIGKFVLTLVELKAAPKAPDTMFMESSDLPEMVYFLEGDHGKTPLSKIVLFGKAQSVEVHAEGFWVRPVHGRIEQVAPDRHHLACFGKARVKVNGLSVSSADLKLEDEITVGRSRFRLTRGMGPGKQTPSKTKPATSNVDAQADFDNKKLDN